MCINPGPHRVKLDRTGTTRLGNSPGVRMSPREDFGKRVQLGHATSPGNVT